MNKKKLSYLPFNILFCAGNFVGPYLMLSTFSPLGLFWSMVISAYLYLNEVFRYSDRDYLEDRIKALEEKVEMLEDGKVSEVDNN